ncbi:MAG TPA: nitrilase-related carbon-nitrogen hydrolase, partial [Waddliaceae bacterium]
LTGSLIIEEEGHYFNRLIWMLPNGQYGYYDKRHLFAYAGEDQKFSPGNKRLIASVKGWKVNLLVCYDLRFPVWSRQGSAPSVLSGKPPSPRALTDTRSPSSESHPTPQPPPSPEYDLLIYVANWPQRRSHAWKTLLQARAIENQSYTVGVNRVGDDGNNIHYSGDSMIIDPLGEVLYQAPGEEAVFTYTLQKDKLEEARSCFPFWLDADHFSIDPAIG